MAAVPHIAETSFGRITIDGWTYEHDVWILADGEVKKRKKKLAKRVYGTSHRIGPEELAKLCQDPPDVLIIGAGQSALAELTDEGAEFLRERGIEWQVLPTPQALAAYNRCPKRKAALIHVTC